MGAGPIVLVNVVCSNESLNVIGRGVRDGVPTNGVRQRIIRIATGAIISILLTIIPSSLQVSNLQYIMIFNVSRLKFLVFQLMR